MTGDKTAGLIIRYCVLVWMLSEALLGGWLKSLNDDI